MSKFNAIGDHYEIVLGSDLNLDVEVCDYTDPNNPAPVDVAGWGATFDMRDQPHAGTSIISRSCSITGTFNSDRDVNTQRVRAVLTDDDSSDGSKPLFPAGLYYFSVKRTDSGAETVLAHGTIRWTEATQK